MLEIRTPGRRMERADGSTKQRRHSIHKNSKSILLFLDQLVEITVTSFGNRPMQQSSLGLRLPTYLLALLLKKAPPFFETFERVPLPETFDIFSSFQQKVKVNAWCSGCGSVASDTRGESNHRRWNLKILIYLLLSVVLSKIIKSGWGLAH